MMSAAGSLQRLRNGSAAVPHRSRAWAVRARRPCAERARHARSRLRERRRLKPVEEHQADERPHNRRGPAGGCRVASVAAGRSPDATGPSSARRNTRSKRSLSASGLQAASGSVGSAAGGEADSPSRSCWARGALISPEEILFPGDSRVRRQHCFAPTATVLVASDVMPASGTVDSSCEPCAMDGAAEPAVALAAGVGVLHSAP